jgi:hypothetical protein
VDLPSESGDRVSSRLQEEKNQIRRTGPWRHWPCLPERPVLSPEMLDAALKMRFNGPFMDNGRAVIERALA